MVNKCPPPRPHTPAQTLVPNPLLRLPLPLDAAAGASRCRRSTPCRRDPSPCSSRQPPLVRPRHHPPPPPHFRLAAANRLSFRCRAAAIASAGSVIAFSHDSRRWRAEREQLAAARLSELAVCGGMMAVAAGKRQRRSGITAASASRRQRQAAWPAQRQAATTASGVGDYGLCGGVGRGWGLWFGRGGGETGVGKT
ncbi:hypothetical protein Syun_020660 [Stephania yunnanensis]|uniref:Uncharacterized protein n=1 Tax=Stephania yunnanensis TaxID=152371 RepID=A0AAP0IEB2_9MAGN